MVLKLDPSIPLVWRDPMTLQFGVDPARLVLHDVTNADERMIAALVTGVSEPGIDMIAMSAGATPIERARLLEAIRPLMDDDASRHQGVSARPGRPSDRIPGPAALIEIAGVGPTADAVASALADSGLRVRHTPTALDETDDPARRQAEPHELPAFGIAVGHYVLEPAAYGHWLRRDIPHLSIVFGDAAATIGPLVEPGSTACLYCVEHFRREADPAWAAIASQLWGRTSSAEGAISSREVTALTARLVISYLAGHDDGLARSATSFRLSTDTGGIVRREWMPHPACGCVQLPGMAGRYSEPIAGSA